MCCEVQEGGKIANSSDEEGPGSSDIGVFGVCVTKNMVNIMVSKS